MFLQVSFIKLKITYYLGILNAVPPVLEGFIIWRKVLLKANLFSKGQAVTALRFYRVQIILNFHIANYFIVSLKLKQFLLPSVCPEET